MTVLASRDSKRRLRNTLQWSAPDAGGIAVGVGIKHGIKCGDSLPRASLGELKVVNVGADNAPDTLSPGVGVGNKRRQAGGHNLSLRIPTRSLVVSGIYVACDQRCPDL